MKTPYFSTRHRKTSKLKLLFSLCKRLLKTQLFSNSKCVENSYVYEYFLRLLFYHTEFWWSHFLFYLDCLHRREKMFNAICKNMEKIDIFNYSIIAVGKSASLIWELKYYIDIFTVSACLRRNLLKGVIITRSRL